MRKPPGSPAMPERPADPLRRAIVLRRSIGLAFFLAILAVLGLTSAPAAPPKKPAVRPPTASEGRSEHERTPYNRGLGGKARTSMFGIEAEGYKFVYVLDRSASMGGNGAAALKAAKAELLASLGNLEQTHQFQIIFYNEKPTAFNPTGDPHRALFATEENKAAAEKFVRSITPFDGTRHDDALMLAIKLQPNVIFWLTDADDPKLGPNQLARINRMAGGITIHAIEFGSGPQAAADNFLVKIARENGGQHAYVDVSKRSPGR